MAVYERSWKRYKGDLTPLAWRFLVVSRYAIRDAFSSRIFTAFYAACFLPTIVGLFIVYFAHNLGLLAKLGIPPEVIQGFTMSYLKAMFSWQTVPAFFVAVIVSPSLVAADLSNNALPLFLARPINRRDYVLGKMAVLGILLSPITWIGGLTVLGLQAYLEGGTWWLENYRIGLGYFVGHLAWILVISLLTLAISAWVRYKPVARGALFAILLVLWGMSALINLYTHSHMGDFINIGKTILIVVVRFFDPLALPGLPTWAAWMSLIFTCLISLAMLWRKLRAHEVVQ